MRRAAFLTLEPRGSFVVDDALAIEELARRGWWIEEIPWRREVDWKQFECVVVRSTWDYQRAPDAFLAALERIDASTVLANPLEVVRWNLRKTYLRDLQARGVPIVPTTFGRGLSLEVLHSSCENGPRVIKPVVSANADLTFVIEPATPLEQLLQILAALEGREWMLQPFVRSVREEGEYSLFYFGGKRSHAVLKTPKRGDFRVQEEHGGEIRAVSPPSELVAAADRVIAAVPQLLQARVDLVRLDDGSIALMELELIEPSLYFRTEPAAAAHFADAFEALLPR